MVKKLKKKLEKMKLFQLKVTSLFFTLIGLFSVIFISYFLYFKISAPQEVDDILPTDNLVFFTEFSKTEFPDVLWDNSYFQNQLVETNLKQYLNKNLDQLKIQTSNWLGDRVAFALYKKEGSKNWDYYLLLENRNQKKALDFLRSLGVQNEELLTEDYQRFKIISFSQTLDLNCSFMFGYFACANTKQAMKELIDVNKTKISVLSAFPAYQKVKNNLPQISAGKLYLNFKNLDYNQFDLYLSPIRDSLKEGGIVVDSIEKGIRLNSYLALNKGLVETGAVVLKNDLTPYIYADTLGMYLGGTNLTQVFQKILNAWDEVTPYFSIILEGMLRAQIQNYLGDQVSLEEDFYPLFMNHYALELNLDSETFLPQIKIILQTTDLVKILPILDKLYEGFYNQSGKYMPQIEKTTLPDGSVVSELIADNTKVQKKTEKFNGIEIKSISIEGVPFGFAYSVYEDKIFIASDVLALKDNLSLIQNPQNSLAKNPQFLALKKQVLLQGEETSYFNLTRLTTFLDVIGLPEKEKKLLSLFDHVFFSTKWFDDGMANEIVLMKE